MRDNLHRIAHHWKPGCRGSVHFWCNFLGIKKVYKVENQLLVDYSERRGRGLATTLPMVAPLNAHPFCSPQGPLQAHCAKSCKPPTLFSHLRLQVNLRQRYKNKRYRFLDTFLLRGLAEREGFRPNLCKILTPYICASYCK